MSRHRFFQMHLSTAVVLMLVAGVLVWANVREQPFLYDSNSSPIVRYGWPFVYYPGLHYRDGIPLSVVFTLENYERHWNTKSAVLNSLIALAILLAVWQLCEWRIRRREARNSGNTVS